MTLRDWFAGQALAGLNAQADNRAFDGDGEDCNAVTAWRKELCEHDAKCAYLYADAMLSARQKENAHE